MREHLPGCPNNWHDGRCEDQPGYHPQTTAEPQSTVDRDLEAEVAFHDGRGARVIIQWSVGDFQFSTILLDPAAEYEWGEDRNVPEGFLKLHLRNGAHQLVNLAQIDRLHFVPEPRPTIPLAEGGPS